MFVDASNRVWAAFGADRSGKVETGTADVEIMRGRLVDIGYRKSKAVSDEIQREGGAGIEYVFGDSADSIEQDDQRVHVRFSKSQETRTFDFVVGADGLHSKTRKLVFGEAADGDRVKRLEMYSAFFSMPSGPTDSTYNR